MKFKKIATLCLSFTMITSTSLTGFSAQELSSINTENMNVKNVEVVSSTSDSAISTSIVSTETQNGEVASINYEGFEIAGEPGPVIDYLDIYEKIKATENYENFYWIEFPMAVSKDKAKFLPAMARATILMVL